MHLSLAHVLGVLAYEVFFSKLAESSNVLSQILERVLRSDTLHIYSLFTFVVDFEEQSSELGMESLS